MKPKRASVQMGLGRPSDTAKAKEAKAVPTFEGPEARLNVTLPVRVHQRVKVKAAQNRLTIREYILGLLREDGIAMD